jgi:hypothetical protein
MNVSAWLFLAPLSESESALPGALPRGTTVNLTLRRPTCEEFGGLEALDYAVCGLKLCPFGAGSGRTPPLPRLQRLPMQVPLDHSPSAGIQVLSGS